MKSFSYLFNDNDDDIMPDPELDTLFNQLEQFEPPEALIKNIMSTVSQLSLYPQALIPTDREENGEGLIVRREHIQPS